MHKEAHKIKIPSSDSPPTSRHFIKSLKKKEDAKRSLSEKIADGTTKRLGSITFLALNIIWFALWIVANAGLIPRVEPFDPFPFSLLTMIVSLEAIALAILVLISQNRAEKVDDLREEIDLQVDVITEQEVTKIMKMMVLLLEKNGITMKDDGELRSMLKTTNFEKLQKALEAEIIEKK